MMANEKPNRALSGRVFPDEAVRFLAAAAHVEGAVSCLGSCRGPLPTRAEMRRVRLHRPVLVDLRPEALSKDECHRFPRLSSTGFPLLPPGTGAASPSCAPNPIAVKTRSGSLARRTRISVPPGFMSIHSTPP